MSLALYFDVHAAKSIAKALRRRGVDVLTAQDDGTTTYSDLKLLDRAGQMDRLLFTRDADFLIEASARQRRGQSFTGILYAHQVRVSIGQCIESLELIAVSGERADFQSRVTHLPLR